MNIVRHPSIRRVLPVIAAVMLPAAVHGQAWRSTLYPEHWTPPEEPVSFTADKLIQDFSYAGYRRGEQPIPNVAGPVFDVTTYGADPSGASDSTVAVQNAIDAAAAAGGGVVFLPAGTFRVSPQGDNTHCLRLSTSNIVLRGAGTAATFLLNTSYTMTGKAVIQVSPPSTPLGTSRNITADLPGPTRRIPVINAGSFAPGSIVRIQWSFTDDWVIENNQQTWWNETNGRPANATYFREVVAANAAEGWIEVDVPTRYAIKTRDAANVRTISGQLTQVGIELLAIGNLQHPGDQWGENDYAVEGTSAYDTHASWLVRFTNVRDSWISSVHSFQAATNDRTCHMLSNGISLSSCLRVTVQNCELRRPQYGGGGGNGYMYRIQTSNDCLVKNSIADFSRHGFVVSHAGTSGNVFHQCEDRETQRATGSTTDGSGYTTGGSGSDNHMHFSHSNLWDQCHAHNSFYTAHHRTFSGTTPHGLTSAHGVYWNTSGSGTRYTDIVRSDQLHHGYIIGTSGSRSGATTPSTFATLNSVSVNTTAPVDHLEGIGQGATMAIPSLYLDQLAKRMQGFVVSAGENDVTESTSAYQLGGSIYTYDDTPVSSLWTQVSGPATAVFADASSPTTTVALTEFGTYVLELTVTDGTQSASAQVVIQVATLVPSSLAHFIRRDSQNTSTLPLGYFTSASDLIGTQGSSGSRDDRNVVLGYTLPTLPVATTLDSASFKFEITVARDSTGATNLPDLHAYLLDTVNPVGSGLEFAYHGPLDPSPNAKRVGITSVPISGTLDNHFAAGEQRRTFTLDGDALALLKGYYNGHVPTRSTVYFRFNLSGAPSLTNLIRYRVNSTAGGSSLQLVPTLPVPTYTISYDGNGATGGTTPSSQTKTQDVDLALAFNSGGLVRSGHVFLGWNTEAGGTGTDYAAGATYGANASATLFAKWDAIPSVDAGPDQVVMLDQFLPWTPAQLTTAAWYDASDPVTMTVEPGNKVSEWRDKSGNNNHATQLTETVRPTSGTATIGGRPAVSFRIGDGSNKQFLTAPNHTSLNLDSSGGVNVFAVMNYLGFVNNGSAGLNVALSKGQILAAEPAYGIRVSSGNALGYQAGSNGQATATDFSNQQILFSGTGNFTANSSRIFVNGQLRTTTSPTGSFTSDNTAPLHIGRDNSTARHADVDFGEILVAGGVLTDDERQKTEGYLAHKWGMADKLPAGHRHKDEAPLGSEAFAIAALDGTATDSENDSLSLTWSKVSGPGDVTFADPSAADSTATFSSVGTYVLRLTASDGLSTNSDEVTIAVDGPVVEPKTYDIYLIAGQSNADGRGTVSDLTGDLAPYAGPQPNVKIFYVNPANSDPDNPTYNTGWTTLAPGFSVAPGFSGSFPSNSFGFGVSLAKALAAKDPDRNVAIIKVTRGGTNLHTQWDPVGGDNFMWQTFANKVPEALAALTANGDIAEIRGMFWHQGESDGSNPTYQSDLVEFIAACRTLTGKPDLPFAIGELEREEGGATRSSQLAAMANVAAADPRTIVVSSAGLPTSDGTHFTSAACISFGERLARAFHDFVDGVTFAVTYDGNGPTDGSVPVDPQNPYTSVSTATVLGAGDLTKSGHNLAGWNTAANGSGTPYAAGNVFAITENTTLHAQWAPKTTPTITTWPTAAPITEGQPLSAATLTGGNTSVPGTFAYTHPSILPPAGTDAADVVFTPNDAITYNTVQATVNVTVRTLFESWAADEAITFTGDANGDGIADGMAWLLGATSPSANATGLLPAIAGNQAALQATFTMRNPANRGAAVLNLQYGTTLGSWTTVAVPGESGTHDGVVFAITPNGETSTVVVTVPATTAPDGRIFLRLSGAEN